MAESIVPLCLLKQNLKISSRHVLRHEKRLDLDLDWTRANKHEIRNISLLHQWGRSRPLWMEHSCNRQHCKKQLKGRGDAVQRAALLSLCLPQTERGHFRVKIFWWGMIPCRCRTCQVQLWHLVEDLLWSCGVPVPARRFGIPFPWIRQKHVVMFKCKTLLQPVTVNNLYGICNIPGILWAFHDCTNLFIPIWHIWQVRLDVQSLSGCPPCLLLPDLVAVPGPPLVGNSLD